MGTGSVTFKSAAHPARQGDAGFVLEVVKAAERLMSYMKRSASDLKAGFLDCHHWTKLWVDEIDKIEPRFSRGGAPATLLVQQIQINFLRKDSQEGVSGGEHVALLVGLRSCWLLIDHTHNQFDLPKQDIRNRALIEAHYRAVWQNMATYIGHGKAMEEVIVKWLSFLEAKPYMKQVHNFGIKYLNKYHEMG